METARQQDRDAERDRDKRKKRCDAWQIVWLLFLLVGLILCWIAFFDKRWVVTKKREKPHREIGLHGYWRSHICWRIAYILFWIALIGVLIAGVFGIIVVVDRLFKVDSFEHTTVRHYLFRKAKKLAFIAGTDAVSPSTLPSCCPK